MPRLRKAAALGAAFLPWTSSFPVSALVRPVSLCSLRSSQGIYMIGWGPPSAARGITGTAMCHSSSEEESGQAALARMRARKGMSSL